MSVFPDGLYQYGGVPVGGGMLPVMGGDSKVFFVDPANGSDSNSGLKPSKALDTIAAAYAKCTANMGDTVYLLGNGNTSGTAREAVPLTWGKDNTHLVGLGAPCKMSQRTRITPVSGVAATNNPMFLLSADACVISNVAIQHWGAGNGIVAEGMEVTGQRNYIHNCHIVGMTQTDVGDEATACDLLLSSGANENTFKGCTFGVDTFVRTAANANIMIKLNQLVERNIFDDCLVVMRADADAPLVVDCASGSITGFLLFKNCTFINNIEGTGTLLNEALDIDNACGAPVILHNTMAYGFTEMCQADNGNVYVDGVGGAATGGLGIAATN